MPETSALGPIDPASVSVSPSSNPEEEKAAPWIVRKLVGSMTGRIVMSSYETLRATGTNVICLSPWGDSSPLFLPCIRFRDLAVHTVIAATGGMAAVAAPVMGPMSDVVISTLGDSILVELGLTAGFGLGVKVANDLVFSQPIKHVVPIHSKRLETTGVKVLLITLRYKHTMTDAALGFYRSSVHEDSSLFSAVKDYLAVEKGWFSPYLFASARRPIIPRNLKPDIIFCHGPFLSGDYRIGETLLAESASIIILCTAPITSTDPAPAASDHSLPHSIADIRRGFADLHVPSLSSVFHRSRTPSPEPSLTPLPAPPVPRRMVIVVLGLKPHRGGIWASSARPDESVMNYVLMNGCPAVVVPVKVGAPLVAWDGLTFEKLWDVELPEDEGEKGGKGKKYEGIVDVIFEFLGLCIEWERVVVDDQDADARVKTSEDAGEGEVVGGVSVGGAGGADVSVDGGDYTKAKLAVKAAIMLLVAAAIRSKESKEVKKEIDPNRSGIAMWRIP